MEWKLDDNRPIWIQLQEQLTRKILSGWYRAGERLPSVRELAAEAGVAEKERRIDEPNVDTMSKCVEKLWAKGSFEGPEPDVRWRQDRGTVRP